MCDKMNFTLAYYDPASTVRRATSMIPRGDETSCLSQNHRLGALREHADP
jgi:hypothetical protein